MTNYTLSRIFNWHHTIVTGTCYHFSEYFVNCRHRHRCCAITKVFDRSLLGKCAFRSQKSDFDRLLQSQTRRHYLPKKACHIFIINDSIIRVHYSTENLSLSLWTIISLITLAFFYLSNLLSQTRTATYILHNLHI